MNKKTARVQQVMATVADLQTAGWITVKDNEVTGTATDGTEVSLGNTYDVAGWLALGRYLDANPSPDNW